MKNVAKFFFLLSLIAIISLPLISLAQTQSANLVPCGTEKYGDNEKVNGVDVSRQVKNPCHFADLLKMVNKVINFVLFDLTLPISAILFAYAGFLLVSSGGSTEQRGKAIGVFKNVGIGLILAVAAWLIVSTLLSIVGFDGSWIGFK